jgi:hypothetical protein
MMRSAAVWALAFTVLASSATVPAMGRGDSSAAVRFLSRDEPALTQYRAYRRMHARSERFNQEAWLEAWTELDERGFRYEIVSERGSDKVRNKVLRAVLQREYELIAGGQTGRGELSAENYEFAEAATHGDGVRYVLLKPKRKDVLLVDGRMVLSQDGRELLRVEGRLSKNPSFWTSLVNVIRHYARLDGVRVPISTETIAKVKLAGLSRLEVSYEYETINGRPVSLTARRTLAAAIGR